MRLSREREPVSGNLLPNVLPNLEDLRIPFWTSDNSGPNAPVAGSAGGWGREEHVLGTQQKQVLVWPVPLGDITLNIGPRHYRQL